jgi:hypothetical protein
MRRLAVVVVDPATEVGEHGLRVAQLVDVHVVAFERVHEAFGKPVALRAIRRPRDRHQAEFVRVEDRGRGCVLRAVVGELLEGVGRRRHRLAEARPERFVHERTNVPAV